MREFVEAVVSYPTVLYTSLLAVVAVYWGFVVAGIVDVDFFDPGAKLDAAASGLEGAHDAAGHSGHAGHDGAADAHHDGTGGGDDGVGGDHGHDQGHDSDHGGGGPRGVSGLLALLGARGIPLTVTLSLLVLWGWLVCGLGMWAAEPLTRSGLLRATLGSGIGFGALIAAGFLTRATVRPLRHAFGTVAPVHKQSVVGMLCRITTTRVDARFGQGEVEDGGAGIIVQVRCNEANELRKGSLALICDHDEEQDVFHVLPREEKPI